MRNHRSAIINKQLVVSWKYLTNGTYLVTFEYKETQTSSRSYQPAIRKAVSDLNGIE